MLETVAPGSFTTHPARINENAWRRSWIEKAHISPSRIPDNPRCSHCSFSTLAPVRLHDRRRRDDEADTVGSLDASKPQLEILKRTPSRRSGQASKSSRKDRRRHGPCDRHFSSAGSEGYGERQPRDQKRGLSLYAKSPQTLQRIWT